jgi:hypothetical protein
MPAFTGETEENQESLNQRSRSPGPIFEPRISQIQRSVNNSTTTFGASMEMAAFSNMVPYIVLYKQADISEVGATAIIGQ